MSSFCSPTPHLSQPQRHRLCHVSRYPRGKTKQDLPFPVHPPIFWREKKDKAHVHLFPPGCQHLNVVVAQESFLPVLVINHSVTTAWSKGRTLISEGRTYEVQLPWAAERQMILWFSTEAACWHHLLTIIMLFLKKNPKHRVCVNLAKWPSTAPAPPSNDCETSNHSISDSLWCVQKSYLQAFASSNHAEKAICGTKKDKTM